MLLTPSLVQVQLVQGEIFLDDPRTMSWPLTRHWVTSSFQWVKSMSGLSWQGARGLLQIYFIIINNYTRFKKGQILKSEKMKKGRLKAKYS